MSDDTLIEEPGQQPHHDPKLKTAVPPAEGKFVCPQCRLYYLSRAVRKVKIYNTETKQTRRGKVRYWRCPGCKARFTTENGQRSY